jgi:hypothetical protein
MAGVSPDSLLSGTLASYGASVVARVSDTRGRVRGITNSSKLPERVIEQLMFDMLNIKIDIEEVDEVA